jgi:hypothetical protein
MLGKKGGNRQTVREEVQEDTITMMNMFSCLQNMKVIKECWGRREETGRRWGRRPRWTPSQWWICSVACRTVKRLRTSGKKRGNKQTVREEAQVDTIKVMNMFSCLQNSKEIKD